MASTSIEIINGKFGRYYVIDNIKYDIHFPVGWAIDHKVFETESVHDGLTYTEYTGPVECGNCYNYGSVNGVFVGYCSNCLRLYNNNDMPRGQFLEHYAGFSLDQTCECVMWHMHPYMHNVTYDKIGIKKELVGAGKGYKYLNVKEEEDK